MAENAAGGGGGAAAAANKPKKGPITFGEKVAVRHFDPRENPSVNAMGRVAPRPAQEGRMTPNIPVLLKNNTNTRKARGLPLGHPLRNVSFTSANRAKASTEMKRGVNMPPREAFRALFYKEAKKKYLRDILAKYPTMSIIQGDHEAQKMAAEQYQKLKYTANNAHEVAKDFSEELKQEYEKARRELEPMGAAGGGGGATGGRRGTRRRRGRGSRKTQSRHRK